MTNFKIETFKGSLNELLEECNPHLSDSKVIESFNEAHVWLIDQFDNVNNNIIPVRKFQSYKNRGQLESFENSSSHFMPVDNEPFCFFYAEWIEKKSHNDSLRILFKTKKVSASWNCDGGDKNEMKFSGVSTEFRDNGLKLAHIYDAGILEGAVQNSKSNDAIKTRFLRSLSPLNVFLFPSCRCCKITSSNYNLRINDWAEDQKIRQIALSFLISKLKIPKDSLSIFLPQFTFLEGWEELAKSIDVAVSPKSIKRHNKPADKINIKNERKSKTMASAKTVSQEVVKINSCPKTKKNSSIDNMINVYKEWRKSFPEAYRLDGKEKSCTGGSAEWLHFLAEGYTANDSFISRYGAKFLGDDYNGDVNFHGDTPCEKMDEFIELYELADAYQDILRPSATFETKTPGENSFVSPKFALKGYEESVSKFFLYHNEWSTRHKKR